VKARRLKPAPLLRPTKEALKELQTFWANSITACVANLSAEKKAAEEEHYERLAEAAEEERIARFNGGKPA